MSTQGDFHPSEESLPQIVPKIMQKVPLKGSNALLEVPWKSNCKPATGESTQWPRAISHLISLHIYWKEDGHSAMFSPVKREMNV